MDSPVAAIIMAAGRSTRMRSKLPKPLHPLCGMPMTAHVILACQESGVERIVVVVGHEAELVQKGLSGDVEFALQNNPKGTGDAVRSAKPLLSDWNGTILVLAGDTPLLTSHTLKKLLTLQQNSESAVTMLTAVLADPTGYGRILREYDGDVSRIIEEKDCTEEQRLIKEWSPSIYAFHSKYLWKSIAVLKPANAQNEYYLTDSIPALIKSGKSVKGVLVDDVNEVLGVNTRVDLAQCAEILRQRILKDHMLRGVSITSPSATYIDSGVEIGQDTTIEPNTTIHSGTSIGEGCEIGPNCIISASKIGNNVKIVSSNVAGSEIADHVSIGPFANIRNGSQLGENVRIGDFVEVKNSRLSAGVKASHLSYIGDADIGENTNIGAGTVTCNYDGYEKHRTTIGKNAFIGTNTTLIAPVVIGDGAFIAAASPITGSVANDAMAIARCIQIEKPGWAAAYRMRKSGK